MEPTFTTREVALLMELAASLEPDAVSATDPSGDITAEIRSLIYKCRAFREDGTPGTFRVVP